MREPARAPLWFVPAGFLIGFLGTMCGIGGGLFAGPLLHFVRGLALRRAAATALLLVMATTAASTTTELLQRDNLLAVRVVVPLMFGVLLGAQLGFRLAQLLSERVLRLFFAVVLALAGLRILLTQPVAAEAVAVTGASAVWLDHAIPLLVGVGGGFLAPILGVGGGLLMVPGLYFAIDGMSFTTARATSLAGGTVGAARSIWLHARAGNVDFRAGVPLAVGALGGATLGVFAVRQPAVLQLGRWLLGAILLVQAVRFAREFRRIG